MLTKEKILKILNELKREIIDKYKVKEVGLFGSYLENEQKETSDIDILVEFEENADLFDLIELSFFLEKKFKKKVDVVSKNALRNEIKESILARVIYI